MGELNNVAMEHQHEDQWCWAAVTQAVCQCFGDNASQEDIVSRTVSNPNCAAGPDSCDSPSPLRFALQTMGPLDSINPVMSFADEQQQIDVLARPLAVGIEFSGPSGTTGHYVLIKGFDTVGDISHVTVLDPAPDNGPESHLAYDGLRSGLTLGGPWTQSFTER
jgi:hypothetical protein